MTPFAPGGRKILPYQTKDVKPFMENFRLPSYLLSRRFLSLTPSYRSLPLAFSGTRYLFPFSRFSSVFPRSLGTIRRVVYLIAASRYKVNGAVPCGTFSDQDSSSENSNYDLQDKMVCPQREGVLVDVRVGEDPEFPVSVGQLPP